MILGAMLIAILLLLDLSLMHCSLELSVCVAQNSVLLKLYDDDMAKILTAAVLK